jgi:hypothetical protein
MSAYSLKIKSASDSTQRIMRKTTDCIYRIAAYFSCLFLFTPAFAQHAPCIATEDFLNAFFAMTIA